MDAFIGRNSKTNQLFVKVNNRELNLGSENTVPTTVSEMHCHLQIGPEEKMKLVNLKPGLNYTWVNGNILEETLVNEDTRIALGPDEWPLDLKMILKELRKKGLLAKKPVAIGHLEAVYQTYHDKMFDIQVKQNKFQALRSITSILSPIALLLGLFMGTRVNAFVLAIYGLIVLSGFFFFYVQWKNSKNQLLEKENIKNEFKKNFVCPGDDCKRYLGEQSYKDVLNMKRCPHCQTPFKESI